MSIIMDPTTVCKLIPELFNVYPELLLHVLRLHATVNVIILGYEGGCAKESRSRPGDYLTRATASSCETHYFANADVSPVCLCGVSCIHQVLYTSLRHSS